MGDVGKVRSLLRLVPALEHEAPRAPQAKAVPSLDDVELIAAMRAGDDGAATAFHDRLRPRIHSTIRRLLGRHDSDHEDLVQLTLIELVRSVARFRGECSLESWAAAVTAHVVFREMRRRRAERRVFSAPTHERVVDGEAPSSARIVIARDLVRRIRAHLETLDEAKSSTFLLHDVCGFDLREIAGITGVSVAAAQTRLVRGRREIHDLIATDPDLARAFQDWEGES